MYRTVSSSPNKGICLCAQAADCPRSLSSPASSGPGRVLCSGSFISIGGAASISSSSISLISCSLSSADLPAVSLSETVFLCCPGIDRKLCSGPVRNGFCPGAFWLPLGIVGPCLGITRLVSGTDWKPCSGLLCASDWNLCSAPVSGSGRKPGSGPVPGSDRKPCSAPVSRSDRKPCSGPVSGSGWKRCSDPVSGSDRKPCSVSVSGSDWKPRSVPVSGSG